MWRATGLLKRDLRHDHSEGVPLYRSHKPTIKWCRGKVGEQHDVTWHKKSRLLGGTLYIGKCNRCGKRMYRDGDLDEQAQQPGR
jgi:hypothetical protein